MDYRESCYRSFVAHSLVPNRIAISGIILSKGDRYAIKAGRHPGIHKSNYDLLLSEITRIKEDIYRRMDSEYDSLVKEVKGVMQKEWDYIEEFGKSNKDMEHRHLVLTYLNTKYGNELLDRVLTTDWLKADIDNIVINRGSKADMRRKAYVLHKLGVRINDISFAREYIRGAGVTGESNIRGYLYGQLLSPEDKDRYRGLIQGEVIGDIIEDINSVAERIVKHG